MPKTLVLAVVPLALWMVGCGGAAPVRVYDVQVLVPGGSPFHGVHGLRFDSTDTLYAASVIGQSLFRVDTATGEVETFVGPPEGMADDLAIAPDGTFVWTAIEDGIVYAKAPDGPVRRLVEGWKGANAVSFSPDGRRLFVTLVFYADALYELDLAGTASPRLILEDLGGLNAFEVADDGMIYGPLVFGGRIVRIDPDAGTMTTVTDAVQSPGALKLSGDGSAFVLDSTDAGSELKKIDLSNGTVTQVATLPFGADNLALDSEGRVFVSLSEVNAIAEVDVDTGDVRYVVSPASLTMPAGLAVVTGGDGDDLLYVGDGFGGVRLVNGSTGAIENTPVDIFMPTHVSATADRLVVGGEVLFGPVQRLDRTSFAVLDAWDGFDVLRDALEAPDGSLVVAEHGSGRLLRVRGPERTDRETIAENLAGPSGLAWAGDAELYVTETTGGRLLRVALTGGASTVVATGLRQPEGVAVLPDGTVVVVEVAARQVTAIDPANGARTTIAADLPIGIGTGPSLFRGIAASASALYMTTDIGNAIYKLRPRD